MSNTLKGAQSYKGNRLTSAEISTLKDIATSIHLESLKTPWEKMSPMMQDEFLAAKAESVSKQAFVKNVKKRTGLLKTSDLWIQWALKEWY